MNIQNHNDENYTKIRMLYKALDECNSIIEVLEQENDRLKRINKQIPTNNTQSKKCDLSKIRGD